MIPKHKEYEDHKKKFPDFFRVGIFIDSKLMKLSSPSK